MGMSIEVARAGGSALAIQPFVERLAAQQFAVSVVMVDGALVMPRSEPPPTWNEVRLKTPSGMVTLARRPPSPNVSVTVFGNADANLIEAQRRVAAAVEAQP